MKKLFRVILATIFVLTNGVAMAANAPIYLDEAGHPQGAKGVILLDTGGNFVGAGLDATTFTNLIGPTNDTAAASDTSTATINARLQRLAQRVTTLISLFPSALGTSGGLKTESQSATTGGVSSYPLIFANTTNSTLISAGQHQVYVMANFNVTSTIAYVKFYDKATAPTCGTDVPVFVGVLPANAGGSGHVIPVQVGLSFLLGIGICVTAGIANNDTTAVAANSGVVNILWK